VLMKNYMVSYKDEDGTTRLSDVVERFDSLNELSAKTIAINLLQRGYKDVKICEVDIKPIYEIRRGEPRMVKIDE